MKVTSRTGASPQDYIQQMTLRNPTTRKVYRCILDGFQRFIAEQVPAQPHLAGNHTTVVEWSNPGVAVPPCRPSRVAWSIVFWIGR